MKPHSGAISGRMILLGFLALHVVVVGLFVVLWLENRDLLGSPKVSYVGADTSGVVRSLFSNQYPLNPSFKSELELLRHQKRLEPENEILISQSTLNASHALSIPPALLWCLLFQESRLDHLLNVHDEKGAKGLGQFSYFSFHEVNHQLGRFTDDNLKMWTKLVGYDSRPIAPRRESLTSPASYYSIPTAVAASSAYLNNRYHQLRRVLERKDIPYHPDLLWLHAVMAYNKGTRSVLAFWNQAFDRGGRQEVRRLLNDPKRLYKALDTPDRLTRALAPIWPRATAERYGQELSRHMDRIRDCSVEKSL